VVADENALLEFPTFIGRNTLNIPSNFIVAYGTGAELLEPLYLETRSSPRFSFINS
jgi:hypothetical protein